MLLLPEKRCYPGVLRVWMVRDHRVVFRTHLALTTITTLQIGNGAAYTFVLVFFSIIGGGPQNLTCTQVGSTTSGNAPR